MSPDQLEILNKVDAFMLKCGGVHEPYKFCANVLDGLNGIIRFDQGVLLVINGNQKIVYKHFVNFPRKWSAIYLKYYRDYPLGALGIDVDATERPNNSYIHVIEWNKLGAPRDEFMENYIRPLGLKRTLVMLLFDLHGSPSACFALDRLDDAPFSDLDIGILNRIAQHLNNLYKNLFVRPSDQPAVWEDIPGAETLTAREAEIVELICDGITPANISSKLNISIGTTNKHIAHIYKKLDVGSRQELLVKVLGS